MPRVIIAIDRLQGPPLPQPAGTSPSMSWQNAPSRAFDSRHATSSKPGQALPGWRTLRRRLMTIPGFGRITPIQGDMLELAGYNLDPMRHGFDPSRPDGQQLPAEVRADIMRRWRESLVRRTRQDFGFDLKAWHNYLVSRPELGYTHSYAFRSTCKFIEAAEVDPVRCRFLAEMEGSGD